MPDLADHLRALPYFDECPQTTLDLLVGQAVKRHFRSGETIFHEGDPPLSLWLIERGSVKISQVNVDDQVERGLAGFLYGEGLTVPTSSTANI